MTRTRYRIAALCFGLVFLVSCRDETSPIAPADPHAAVRSRASTAPAGVRLHPRPAEAGFIQLSKEIPGGFGGFFFTKDGPVVIYLQDLSYAATARNAVAAVLRNRLLGRRHRGPAVPEIRVERGDYTFLQLADWRDQMSASILGMKETIWIDLDQRVNRVTVGVQTDAAREAVEAKLREMSMPVAAVTFQRASPIVFEDTLVYESGGDGCSEGSNCENAIAPAPEYAAGDSLGDYVRGIKGGLQIAYRRPSDPEDFYRKCTLGFIADYGGSTDGTLDYATASHCTITQNDKDGDTSLSAAHS